MNSSSAPLSSTGTPARPAVDPTLPLPPAPAAPAMSRRQVLESLSGILLGMLVSILATSVVSSSLPRIIADLGGSQASFTWVVTATLLTTAISTPIWGKLADLTNRKVLVQVALVVSVLSSAAAGLANDVVWLIAFRAVQGVGAGGLMALGMVLVADIISPRERGRYMGVMGAVMAVGMVGGPLLGGLITDTLGWRWNFFVGLPVAIAAIIVLQRTLRLPSRRGAEARVDYAGAVLLSVGTSALLLWVTFAGQNFAWASARSVALAGTAVAALALAVWVETRVAEPLIPLRLFRNRMVVLAVVASVAVGLAMFGSSVFLSQYMQVSRGMTPTQSGLMTTPMVVGILLTSTITGNLVTRLGRYRPFMITGAIVLSAGLALMATIDYQTSLVLVGIYLAVLGAGLGMLQQNLVLAAQNTLEIRDIGSGTSLVAFFRTLGGTIGVSVLGALLTSHVTDGVRRGMAGLGLESDGSGSMPDVAALPEPVRVVVEQAYADGIAFIFAAAVPIALVSLVCVLFMKEVPLGQRSGLEQRMEEALESTSPGTTA
ncbi:MAG: MDR family MFS transporter [Cellulomonadaceae bacterium]